MSENKCTIKQLSEMIGLSKRRILQLINTGKLSAKKIGNIWILDLDEIQVFIKKYKK